MLIKITAKRQATFPARVLDTLGVKPGDRIELQEGPDGFVLRAPHRPLAPRAAERGGRVRRAGSRVRLRPAGSPYRGRLPARRSDHPHARSENGRSTGRAASVAASAVPDLFTGAKPMRDQDFAVHAF